MNRASLLGAVILVLVGLLLMPSSAGYAQFTQQTGFQYVIKFICGEADAFDSSGVAESLSVNGAGFFPFDTNAGQFIARGEYSTVINIHNPNGRFVNMFKKIALDGYTTRLFELDRPRFQFQVPGPFFFINHHDSNGDGDGDTPPMHPNFPDDLRFFSPTPKTMELSPDEAFQVNCAEIRLVVNDWTRRSLPQRADVDGAGDDILQDVNEAGDFGRAFLIKGYLIIYSEKNLNVTAIYTACGQGTDDDLDCQDDPSGGVTSIDVEEIRQNVVPPPCPTAVGQPNCFIPKTNLKALSVAAGELKVELAASRLSAITESRLLVYDQSGRQLHDSGFTTSTTLSWRTLAAGKPLANGIYFYVIAVKDVFGRVGHSVGKFALVR
jgi:hypothetical protein